MNVSMSAGLNSLNSSRIIGPSIGRRETVGAYRGAEERVATVIGISLGVVQQTGLGDSIFRLGSTDAGVILICVRGAAV